MPRRMPDDQVKPSALRQRERRARLRQARLEAGWRDGRYRDPAAAPYQPYLAVQRWRLANRDKARLMDRVYKGMRRSKLYLEHWPSILAHYGGCCLCCGATEGVIADHVDSVMPDPETHNVLSNLQPLCRRCNSSKRDRNTDYRPDRGAWIVKSLPGCCAVPLHPTVRRARYGSNGWAIVPDYSALSAAEDSASHTYPTAPPLPP